MSCLEHYYSQFLAGFMSADTAVQLWSWSGCISIIYDRALIHEFTNDWIDQDEASLAHCIRLSDECVLSLQKLHCECVHVKMFWCQVCVFRMRRSPALLCVCVCVLLSVCCRAFELQDTIHALIEENIHLHDQLENLTRALRELRQLLFQHSDGARLLHTLLTYESSASCILSVIFKLKVKGGVMSNFAY